jgi:hypothetical protein
MYANSNFRLPDIGYRQNVRFGVDQAAGGIVRRGAALDQKAGEGKPDTPRRTHCEADPQARTGDGRCRLVEDHAERLGSVRATGGAEWRQGDIELASETRMSPAVVNSSCTGVRPS